MSNPTQARALLFALAGLSLASAAPAATRCVNRTGSGGCYSAIQSAVNAALPGDTILIQAGTYYQSVSVPADKTGVKIIGVSKATVILDPGAPLGDNGITINASRVEVASLTIRNGASSAVCVLGDDVVLRGLNITGPNSAGINVVAGAWNVQILANEVHDTGIGILVGGFGAIIKGNTITHAQSFGISATGDAAQIAGNSVRLIGGMGISATGDGARVSANDVRYAALTAVLVMGRYPTVERNTLSSAVAGLRLTCVDCFGGSVLANTVTNVWGDGALIVADGPGLLVQGNTISKARTGRALNGDGFKARANRVSDVGNGTVGHGMEIYGADNTVSGNTVINSSSSGFYVDGDTNTLTSNIANGTHENGFTVISGTGNVLTSNQTTADAAQGFAVLAAATNTILTSNRAARNRVDYCNEGTGTTSTGTVFGTASTACPILH